MRVAVEHILGMLAAGETPEKLLREFPFLEAGDIQACLTERTTKARSEEH
jgi:uncharacterized protein (DUF433 family)